jgi:hypothetical protein
MAYIKGLRPPLEGAKPCSITKPSFISSFIALAIDGMLLSKSWLNPAHDIALSKYNLLMIIFFNQPLLTPLLFISIKYLLAFK